MTRTLAFLVLQVIYGLVFATEQYPEVTTPLGTLRGHYQTSYGGRRFEAYQGIPYAKPPIGKLRFQAPRKFDPWTGVLVADRTSLSCLQYNHFPLDPLRKVEGSEDCLYLNIYAPVRGPERQKTDLYPVIFYIHGGAFQFGAGTTYGPKYLLDRDVIFVTFNYRLGPLGFLSTEDDVVPGNMGLKDQNFALRWVSENIEAFGGDPKRITLFGQSAGGASVHYHYLSPLSKGLFQGGWSLSGNTLDCWPQAENSLEKAKKLSSILGCSTINVREMIRCLRYRPAHRIVQAVGDFMPWLYNPYTPFGPVVEKAGKSPFIDESPIDIISSGKMQDLPWITGVTSEEGLYPAAEFVANPQLLQQLNDNWEEIAPHLLDFNFTIPTEMKAQVAKTIRQHYLGSKNIDESTVSPLIQMVGDRLFVYDAEKAARLHAKVNRKPTWFYYFTYRGAHSLSEMMSGSSKDFGVSHIDDLCYAVDTIFDPTTQASDRSMQKSIIDLWVSFATTGVPDVGVEWSRLNPTGDKLSYLHIAGPDKIAMGSQDNLGEKKFWNSIDFQENKPLGGDRRVKNEL